MGTVEVVIRIPQEKYKLLTEMGDCVLNHNERAIKHGTVLPKGHGRLIDVDTYRKEMLDSREFDFFKRLDMQPTIIDADKEYVCELIDKLPSVTPKEKTGHWIQQPRYDGDDQPDLVCPNCGFKISWWDMGNFCAKCGTGLEGGAG